MTKPWISLTDVDLRFLEKDVCHFHFKTTEDEVPMSSVKALHMAICEHKEVERCFMIISIEPGSRLTQEARDYASSEAFDDISQGDAIIRADYSHEMAANFFIRFNKPGRPVNLVPDMDKAIDWIREQKEQSA